MPNYDFVCEEGHRTRVFRLISQMDEPCSCETCGSDTRRGFFKEEESFAIIDVNLVKLLEK